MFSKGRKVEILQNILGDSLYSSVAFYLGYKIVDKLPPRHYKSKKKSIIKWPKL
jgi:hypothetical protein